MGATRQMRRHQERMARKGKAVLPGVVQKKLDRSRHPADRLVSVALIRDGEIHKGFKSHADLRASLGDKDPYTANPTDECGFWTEQGLFVTRRMAVPIAIDAGQLSAAWRSVSRDLLSSDLSW